MTAFWVLESQAGTGDVLVFRYDPTPELEDRYFEACTVPVGEPVQLFYEDPVARKTDLVGGIQTFIVVSARFRGVLTEAGVTAVEYHPARLVCSADGATDDDYWVLNVLAKVTALDWERADVEVFPGTTDVVSWVERLALREEALQGHHLVRLAEVPPLVLVSADLKRRIETAGLSGVGFLVPDEYGGV